ncbi:hypothetical protein [Streptomyces sp. SGAir0957]
MVVAARGLAPLPLFLMVAALAAPVPAAAAPREAACDSAPGSHAFPLRTAVHDGPDSYYAGGAQQTWSLELTNATGATCRDVHPVLVLVDGERALRPEQIRLAVSHGRERARPVSFERTAHQENVGVFDKGRAGFTVGPGRTVTVRVRLAFTADTRPDHVVASAALVRRRTADDGDWVGESRDYPFDILPGDGSAFGAHDPDPTGPGHLPGGDGTARDDGRPLPEQLAATGPGGSLLRLLCAAAACLVGGAALMLGARRRGAARR